MKMPILLGLFRLLAVTALLLSSVPASAQAVVYSNLGPGDTYSTFSLIPAYGPEPTAGSPGNVDVGVNFTTNSTSHFITAARLPFFYGGIGTPGGVVRFSVASDASGVPGSILESVDVPGDSFPFLNPASSSGLLSTIAFTGTTQLAANSSYWLTWDVLTGDMGAGPALGAIPSPTATRTNAGWEPGGTFFTPGFQILGSESPTAVPESSSLALFIPALGVLGWMRTRRRWGAESARRARIQFSLAVVMLSLALGTPAAAQTIVYSGVQNISGTDPDTVRLDLDSNGVDDFEVRARQFVEPTFKSRFVFFTGIAGNEVLTHDIFFVAPLGAGVEIGPSLPSGVNPGFIYGDRLLRGHAENTDGFGEGNWPQSADRFIGVKFLIGASTHYGWIRANPTVTDDESTFVIRDWAYNSTADEAILTGDTGAPAVPEPGALVLFLPALALVCRLRRHRHSGQI